MSLRHPLRQNERLTADWGNRILLGRRTCGLLKQRQNVIGKYLPLRLFEDVNVATDAWTRGNMFLLEVEIAHVSYNACGRYLRGFFACPKNSCSRGTEFNVLGRTTGGDDFSGHANARSNCDTIVNRDYLKAIRFRSIVCR